MDRQLRDDTQYLAACLKLAALGTIKASDKQRLLEHYSQPEAIFNASLAELKDLLKLSIQHLRDALSAIDESRVEEQIALIRRHQIKIVLYNTPTYPKRLKQIDGAPPLLFVQGNIELLSGPQLAMVGSRRASPAGLKTALAFACEFAMSGLSITSGLASGIDTSAHKGALNGIGSTIAIVATGLDEVYPRTNLALAGTIANKGCIVSEFPPLTPARRSHFPQRNRIISGLSLGVLVVEADTRSGSLITARLAGEQGREVFAIPGSIHSPTSRGCHQLIRQGAKLVETTSDVLLEIKPAIEHALRTELHTGDTGLPKPQNLDPETEKVLNQVYFAPTLLEDIAAHSNLPIERVSSVLLQLELAGRVSPLPGGQYQRVPD